MFPVARNYTTKIQRPTVLSWAFSFVLSANHAGFAPILRVPGVRTTWAEGQSVRFSIALCSLKISTNPSAVARAHCLMRQEIMRASDFRV